MNPIIQKKQTETINLTSNQNGNNPDTELNQYFNTLPAFIQENIKQTGVVFHSVGELQQITTQMLGQPPLQ